MQDEVYMKMAIQKTKEGIKEGQTPFGACIVKDGKVISCEHNAVWGTIDSTAHAEVRAIREACKNLGTIDLSGSVLYSTTEPCPMCFSAIHWSRISKIVYGASIEDAQKAGFNELAISNEKLKEMGNTQVEIVGGVMAEENRMLFAEWLASEKAKTY